MKALLLQVALAGVLAFSESVLADEPLPGPCQPPQNPSPAAPSSETGQAAPAPVADAAGVRTLVVANLSAGEGDKSPTTNAGSVGYEPAPPAAPRKLETTTDDGIFTAELKDGTRLIGTPAGTEVLSLETDFGCAEIPFELVAVLRTDAGEGRVRVSFRNGDALSGRMKQTRLEFVTSYGRLSVPLRELNGLLRGRVIQTASRTSSANRVKHADGERSVIRTARGIRRGPVPPPVDLAPAPPAEEFDEPAPVRRR